MKKPCPQCGKKYDSRGIKGHLKAAHGVVNSNFVNTPQLQGTQTPAVDVQQIRQRAYVQGLLAAVEAIIRELR